MLDFARMRNRLNHTSALLLASLFGGSGSGAHSLSESFNIKDSWLGTQRGLLLAVALAR
jgi:hypothetical protein